MYLSCISCICNNIPAVNNKSTSPSLALPFPFNYTTRGGNIYVSLLLVGTTVKLFRYTHLNPRRALLTQAIELLPKRTFTLSVVLEASHPS